MPPEDIDLTRAADLLERLLTDPHLRAEFRRDPARVCAAFGLPDLAERLGAAGRAVETLDLRESKSSLAGVLMAAAVEGIGAFELISHFRGSGALAPEAEAAVDRAFTRVGMPAVVPGEPARGAVGAAAVAGAPPEGAGGAARAGGGAPSWSTAPRVGEHGGASGGAAAEGRAGHVVDADSAGGDGEPRSTCPLCEVKDPDKAPDYTPCERCGGPAPVGVEICAVCAAGNRHPGVDPAPARLGGPSGGEAVVAGLAAAPAAPATGPTVAPVDPSFMSNTNEGGKLHGSEFNVRDAEGAPGPNGRIHAGYDLFADANAPVRAPEGGVVVEVRASRGTSGQIFGGTVKVQGPSGRVWVFRHVTPGAVVEGQTVAAGQEIAKVSPWDDGPEHTHIEVWKTYQGGYNASNMEDPLPYLERLYAGGAPAAPLAVPEPAPAASAPPGAPVAPALPTGDELVRSGRVLMPDGLREQLGRGALDPRVVSFLAGFSQRYQIGVTTVYEDGLGTRMVIASVNGQPVGPGNIAARDLAQELAGLQQGVRPADVLTPWAIGSPGFRNDPGLIDRIEVGFAGAASAAPPPAAAAVPVAVPPAASPPPAAVSSGPPPGGAPVPPAAAPAIPPPPVASVPPAPPPGTPAPAAAPPPPAPAGAPLAEPSGAERPRSVGRATGVFHAGEQPPAGQAAAPPAGPTPPPPAAASDPAVAPAAPAPAPPVPGQPAPGPPVPGADAASGPPASGAASVLPDPSDAYPGDGAPKEAVARWMARQAQKAGLPPELPVMAALVESGLRNLSYGDADSVGFFQMRLSIWDRGEYAGYPKSPELQLKWFIDQATALKERRLREGVASFGADPNAYGAWIADVERPAAQYRGRYQLRLDEARRLIWGSAPSS